MIRSTALLLFVCWTLSSFGQSDAEKFEAFKESYKNALSVSQDSSFAITQNYLNSFSNNKFNLKLEKYKADHFYVTGRQNEADSIYQSVLPVYQEESDYMTVFQIWNRQGSLYYQTGKMLRALDFANDVEEFITKNSDALQSRELQIQIAAMYRIIGIIYAIQAESDDTFNQETSTAYFKKALKTILPQNAPEFEGLILFNIGNVMTEKDSILHYWNRALEVFDQDDLLDDKKGPIYQNIAILHIDEKDYAKGLEYLDLTAPFAQKSRNPYDLPLLNIKYGRVYFELNQYQKAIQKTNEGLEIALQYGMTSLVQEAYEVLIQAYQKTNRYKEVSDTYVKYDTLIRKLERIETERIFRDTEAKYKTKEQQAEIAFLKQEELLKNAQIKQQRLIIGLVVIALIFIIVLTYLLWKRAQQRKKVNAQLIKLNKDRTRFLVNISHELRTPVSLIHGPLQDTLEQLEKNNLNRVQRNLHKIANNTQKLLQLTDEVLDISKLDEGFLQVQLNPIDLRAFVTRAFYTFESLAIRNKIKWNSEISIPEKTYEIDDNKLEKILNNLFSNAIKNTPKNGSVSFSAKVESNQLICHLKDTGKGISEDVIPKIFDRYFQDDSQEKPASGIGIGLSLVKELIDILQGNIQVKSQLKKGTEFTLSIPVKLSDKAARNVSTQLPILDTENRPDIDLSDTNKPHILVIEDHIEMSDFIQQLLSDDYRVSIAGNGMEGIERLQSEQFDLITVDVMMPEMNGIEFVTQLKENSNWKSISTIMITALSGETDKITGLQLGVDDYITKPFSGNELKARVQNLIQNSQVRKENASENPDEKLIGTEKEFLHKAKQMVERNLNNSSFEVKDLANGLNLSVRQTNRVLKKITGLSCSQFIKEVRLQKAYHYLQSRQYATIAEICYAVGFEHPSYFTRVFTNRFGKKPSEML